MRYEQLLDAFDNDITHLRALMSARGVKPLDEVDNDFIDVLREEGYEIPDLADFEDCLDEAD
jgi:hypothetical protein